MPVGQIDFRPYGLFIKIGMRGQQGEENDFPLDRKGQSRLRFNPMKIFPIFIFLRLIKIIILHPAVLLRFGRNGKGSISLYFSAAVLTDDALGVLDNVDLGYYHDYA